MGPSYRVTNGITSSTLPAEAAHQVWRKTKPELRGGGPDSGFIIWPESQFGGRIAAAGTAYIPLPDDSPTTTNGVA
jgi:hypothetical protein